MWGDGALDVPTLTASTPNQGTHSVFDGCAINGARYKKTVMPGVDIKAHGYIVVAPSVVPPDGAPSGHCVTYRWTRAMPPAVHPDMDAVVVKPSPVGSASGSGEADGDPYDWDTALTPGAVPIGEQEDWLWRAAASARGMGVPDRVGRLMVRLVSRAFANDPASRKGKWTDADADAKWDDARVRYPNGRTVDIAPQLLHWVRKLSAGDEAGQDDAEDPEPEIDPDVLRSFKRHLDDREGKRLADEYEAEQERAAAPLRWTTSADRSKRPAMEWLAEGCLPRVGVGVVFGPMFVGKSMVITDLCLSVTNGHASWMGWKLARSGDVGLILMEGAEGFPGRERAWLAAHPGTSSDRLLTFEAQPVDLGSAAFVRDFVISVRDAVIDGQPFRPALLAVDTQGLALNGRDENSRTDMRRVYRLCKQLAAELGCLVLLVTHPGHQHTDRPAGASTQEQDADVSIRIMSGSVEIRKIKEGTKGARRFFGITPSADSAYARHLPDRSPAGQAAADRRSRHDAIVAAVARIQGDQGASLNMLVQEVHGRKQDLSSAVSGLVDDGRLRYEGEGTRKRIFTDERPDS